MLPLGTNDHPAAVAVAAVAAYVTPGEACVDGLVHIDDVCIQVPAVGVLLKGEVVCQAVGAILCTQAISTSAGTQQHMRVSTQVSTNITTADNLC
jgi:hypothetical protein